MARKMIKTELVRGFALALSQHPLILERGLEKG